MVSHVITIEVDSNNSRRVTGDILTAVTAAASFYDPQADISIKPQEQQQRSSRRRLRTRIRHRDSSGRSSRVLQTQVTEHHNKRTA